MRKIDVFEKDIIEAWESRVLRSALPLKAELKALRAAARVPSIASDFPASGVG